MVHSPLHIPLKNERLTHLHTSLSFRPRPEVTSESNISQLLQLKKQNKIQNHFH